MRAQTFAAIFSVLIAAPAFAGSNRLLATGGVMQVEGSAGGGLVPWALIAGLGTDAQIGGSGYCTQWRAQKFDLKSCGLAVGIYDRVELSYAKQTFDLDEIIPGQDIGVDVIGVKVRLLGDAVYEQDRWLPQLAIGAQYKKNDDFDFVPALLGAHDDSGVDLYVAATKVWLAGPFSRTWLANVTLRSSRANQFGILGFGGPGKHGRSLDAELSTAVFLTDDLVAGAEYRQKPDNLRSFAEQDAWDAFVAYFPNKHVSVTAAYADLGRIAMIPGQHGWYLSLQGSL
ncbi:MAG TPA: DUF3034 family protein [Steroidobacteraceae bacterium]|nr:DUF3034 family protein [Steroidobacteraceae bacterium]